MVDDLTMAKDLPGGKLANRHLRFYWVLDVSSTMAGREIAQLNYAVREALPAMQEKARLNPHAAVEVKVLTFGTGTKWLTPAPVPVEDFQWSEVSAGGLTYMGAEQAVAKCGDDTELCAAGLAGGGSVGVDAGAAGPARLRPGRSDRCGGMS